MRQNPMGSSLQELLLTLFIWDFGFGGGQGSIPPKLSKATLCRRPAIRTARDGQNKEFGKNHVENTVENSPIEK